MRIIKSLKRRVAKSRERKSNLLYWTFDVGYYWNRGLPLHRIVAEIRIPAGACK